MRKICVISGTRAEYGAIKPILEAIRDHDKLELALIVTSMHLSNEFGATINEIIEDGFEIADKVEMNPLEDTGLSMAESIGKGIIGISRALKNVDPTIVLITGDRIEALAAAISAAFLNIPIAHLHGGDSSYGGLDESVRHAITKFAHIHFPATEKSAERILKLGEDEWRIFVVGSPTLDSILNMKFLTKKEVEGKFNLNFNKPVILLIQHSVTTEIEEVKVQIIETLKAIEELKIQTIIIYPNSDAGGRVIIKQINQYETTLPFVKIYKSLPYIEYLSLLKYVNVILGNSSSGIVEAPSFKLPAVNIGIRQKGRERSTNILDVPHDRNEIMEAIKKALYDDEFKNIVKNCVNPYGEGKASKIIVDELIKVKINKKLFQKKLSY